MRIHATTPATVAAVAVIAVLALAAAFVPGTVGAGPAAAQAVAGYAQDVEIDERVGDQDDPVLAAIAINQAKGGAPATRAVLGRSDVFADNLGATALAGADG